MKKCSYYIICLALVSFACKKKKIREGIEGLWEIERVEYSWPYPNSFSGTYEFQQCSRKENNYLLCNVITKIKHYYYYLDTTYPERTETLKYAVGKKGKTALIGDEAYQIELSNDKLVLKNKIGSRGDYIKIFLNRQ